ncbi:uncharacterized protein AFUA_5G00320 [Aspergillus fumigatus Af293]|uniref:Uncharacterized protein n=2 Tax=Aspergillus fumigatus TaxID=746128 RepID=Q4WDQ7_ASPFU|nr:hypothetical protein AFUA_5G00320 [Aspergillus fumigatus Af293]EAL86270.1 hypothetical protein AFUA_5G00320 [Aspergillus fumigatus Af293]EDP50876.1 hypothetical protein AFUB_048770 [Aspergillus fumigatus A1163]
MCNSHTFAIPRDQLTDLQQLFGFIVNLGASSSPYWVVCIHVSHYHRVGSALPLKVGIDRFRSSHDGIIDAKTPGSRQTEKENVDPDGLAAVTIQQANV